MLNAITQTDKTLWASITDGKIVVKADQFLSDGTTPNPKAVSRVNKLGKTVYESFYGSIFGTITSMSFETNKFDQKEIKVGLTNKSTGKEAVLTINAESAYGRSFFAQIFNVDLSKEVTFTPWVSKPDENGKKAHRLYIQYDKNNKVDWKLPAGIPEVVFVDLKGKKVVDNISQIKHMDALEAELLVWTKTNGLEYTKKQDESSFLSENVDTTPLTAEEKKQLSKPKDSTKSSKEIADAEDLFDNM